MIAENQTHKLLVLILILSSLLFGQVNTQTIGMCPAECLCSGSGTIGCLDCLTKYFRTYSPSSPSSLSNNSCPCSEGFKQLEVPGLSCCPNNCTMCSSIGNCVQCRTNWDLNTTDEGVEVCVCRQNFYYDGAECRCRSRKEPSNFYWVEPEDACYKCPSGCVCTIEGCISCDLSTNRIVKTVKYNSANYTKSVSVCECLPPLEPTEVGCECPSNCNCTNRNITCNETTSHRYLFDDGLWQCKTPFIQQNGSCICPTLYKLDLSTCLCSSRTNMNAVYFSREGECVVCPSDCTCNQVGCNACESTSNRVILGNSCPCKAPYREIRGKCQCFDPFYYNRVQRTCICMSSVYPNRYYNNPNGIDLERCQKCPDGCTCSADGGCHACGHSALRSIAPTYIPNYYVCIDCLAHGYECNQTCLCVDGTLPTSDGKCGCTIGRLFYQDKTLGSCEACPAKCNCSAELGCYWCQDGSLIIISKDKNTTRSSCSCVVNAVMNTFSGECYCPRGIDAEDNNKCSCSEPYYLSNGSCECLSKKYPEQYLYDKYHSQCEMCPTGCNCSSLGCWYCHPNTLMYVYYESALDYYDCHCLQNASTEDEECSACPQNHFYSTGECIPCSQCKTCDWIGACISCSSGMTLTGGSCTCNNINLTNVDGTCRCPIGQYQNTSDSALTQQCYNCPIYCYDCEANTDNKSFVVCLACGTGLNRINEPRQNCPCMNGFTENYPNQLQYCCNRTCKSCNQTGCTSCYLQMYRTLNSKQQCSCIGRLIDLRNIEVCGCLPGFYRYMHQCYECPPRCPDCFYNQTAKQVHCNSCPNSSNRNSIPYCDCNQYFVEANPPVVYCYAEYCSATETPCRACKGNRILSTNTGYCVCKYGFYEDSRQDCLPCSMEGCKVCTSLKNCRQCHNNTYFLVEETCRRRLNPSEYLYSQNSQQIMIQFAKNAKMKTNASHNLSNVTGQLQPIRQPLSDNSSIIKLVQLTPVNFVYTTNNTITIRFSNPNKNTSRVMLAIQYVFTIPIQTVGQRFVTNDSGTYQASDGWVYVELSKVYSAGEMKFGSEQYHTFIIAAILLTLAICCAIYLRGFKHSQTVFFLQTISFLAFVIKDEEEIGTAYLYNIRTIYFQVGNILRAVIPRDYLESSKGNFPYLTVDSNIIRVAGTALVIAAAVASTSIVLRGLWLTCRISDRLRSNVQAQQFVLSRKRFTYRFLEFIYKTCMYPIIFFAFVNFRNWHAMVLTSNDRFFNISRGIALGYFLAYILVTVFQIWWETIAKVNKAENALELGSACIASLIMCMSMHTKAYLLLILLFAFRAHAYLMVRKRLLRDFHQIEYLKLVSTLLQILTVVCLAIGSKGATISMTVSAIFVQLVHGIAIMFLSGDSPFSANKDNSEVAIQSSSSSRLQTVSILT